LVDGLGQVTRVTEVKGETVEDGEPISDAASMVTTITYKPFGLPEEMLSYTSGLTTFGYDMLGRQTSISTAQTGTTTTKYNAFGEMREESDAAGRVSTFTPDVLGRVEKRTDTKGGVSEVSDFIFDRAPNGVGQLGEAIRSAPDSATTSYAYHPDFAVPVRTELALPTGPLGAIERVVMTQTLDSFGRSRDITYPDMGTPSVPLSVRNLYGANGALSAVVNPAAETQIWWQAEQRDPLNRLTRERFGSGVVTNRAFHPDTGRLTELETSSTTEFLQRLGFKYDYTGNVTLRSDLKRGAHEGFRYDDLDRLWSWYQADNLGEPLSGGWKVTNFFWSSGDFAKRRVREGASSSVTQMVDYTTLSNRMVSSTLWQEGGVNVPFTHDGAGNVTFHPGMGTITYTPFNLPRRVDGTRDVDYFYDALGARVQKVWDGANRREGITYLGGLYERRVSGTEAIHVMRVMAGNKAVAQVTRNAASGVQTTNYIYTDQLGSTTVVHGTDGTMEERRQDPFGNLVAAVGSTIDPKINAGPGPIAASLAVTRGFTGHEEEAELGVVNMGGRIYDPRLGRFLQADPFVVAPLFSQSHNRYSYALNNPLRFLDPSGFAPCDGTTYEGCEADGIHITEKADPWLTFCWEHPDSSVCGGWDDAVSFDAWAAAKGVDLGETSRGGGGPHWTNMSPTERWAVQEYNRLLHNMEAERLLKLNHAMLDGYGRSVALDLVIQAGLFAGASLVNVGTRLMAGEAATRGTNIVYRGLNAADARAIAAGRGLTAKAPNGTWSAAEHVANSGPGAGGAAANSPWLSTTRRLDVARAYDGGHGVVAIDLNRVPSFMTEVWQHAPRVDGVAGLPYHRSIWAQEVTIFQSIPREAIMGFVP
jgi:RHS repeat-associated protein